jgi:hypothetical protein
VTSAALDYTGTSSEKAAWVPPFAFGLECAFRRELTLHA